MRLSPQGLRTHFPRSWSKTRSGPYESRCVSGWAMKLEFHQLDRRYEHLRTRNPERQRRLLASLAASGQQTPIVVIPVLGKTDRYLVIDGHKRVAALEQLGRDTVDAIV